MWLLSFFKKKGSAKTPAQRGENREEAVVDFDQILGDRRLQSRILGFVRKQKGTADEAQDVFLDAVEIFKMKCETGVFDPARGSPNDYIFGIAKGRLYSLRRGRQRAEIRAEKAVEKQQRDEFLAAENRRKLLIYNILAEKFRGNCRLIFLLLSKEYTSEEIHAEMNYSSLEAARVRISECRARLRKLIAERPELKHLLTEKIFDE